MRRPIALRGHTTFFPPHMLGAIVHPYVQDMPGPQGAGLTRLLQESTLQPLSLSAESAAFFQVLCKETIGRSWEGNITPCCCAAVTVLWLSLAPERFPLQANTFRHAADTAGKQKWSLILPSSERDHPVWQLPTSGAMHSGRLSSHLLGRPPLQLSPCQYRYWGGRGLDKGQVCGGHQG